MGSLQQSVCGVAVAMVCLLGCGGAARDEPDAPRRDATRPAGSATVPVGLDHNRVIVEVDFVRSDGGVRRAAVWLDTGNQYLIVVQGLAEELGLDDSQLDGAESEDSVESESPAPPMSIGGVALATEGVGVRVRPGTWVQRGIPAEAFLPASALRNLHVVLDYPAREMTVAPPGVLTPRGEPVACRVNPDTGLFLVEATIDGESVPLGVDTGSAGTWMSTRLTGSWLERYPEWPSAVGALGSANFFGLPFEARGGLLSLPEIGIGAIRLSDVAVLGLDQGLFDWYSQKSAAAVSGFIGANVLSRCRLEVDWPNRMTWWELGPDPAQRDLDIIGLTLRPGLEGSFTVAGVVARDGAPAVDGVEAGDLLVRVGELETTGATMGEVVAALRGRPGEVSALLLERDGERFSLEARVTKFP